MGNICDLVASLTPGFVGADLANVVNEAALLAARQGGETVAREDIMEAIERVKFRINDRQLKQSTISKGLGKLFPWIPSIIGRNDNSSEDGLQGPVGFQSMSGGWPDCLFIAEGLHQCLPPKKLVATRDHSSRVRILHRPYTCLRKSPRLTFLGDFGSMPPLLAFVKDAVVVRSSLIPCNYSDAKSISPI